MLEEEGRVNTKAMQKVTMVSNTAIVNGAGSRYLNTLEYFSAKFINYLIALSTHS